MNAIGGRAVDLMSLLGILCNCFADSSPTHARLSVSANCVPRPSSCSKRRWFAGNSLNTSGLSPTHNEASQTRLLEITKSHKVNFLFYEGRNPRHQLHTNLQNLADPIASDGR